MNQFLEYCEVNKNLSKQTLKLYKIVIESFSFVIKKNKLEDVVMEDITKYIKYLQASKKSEGTIKLYLVILKTMFKRAKKEGRKVLDADMIDLPKVTHKHPKILSKEQLKAVEGFVEGDRNKAIFEVMKSSGMRLNEVINLKVEDIKDNRKISIVGKGGKGRLVIISDLALELIKKHLASRKFQDSEWLFNGMTAGKPVGRMVIENLVNNAGKKAGFKVNPHMLRHIFATETLQDGAAITSVQTLLGHASPNTTSIYLHLTNDFLESEWKKRKQG